MHKCTHLGWRVPGWRERTTASGGQCSRVPFLSAKPELSLVVPAGLGQASQASGASTGFSIREVQLQLFTHVPAEQLLLFKHTETHLVLYLDY